MANAKPGNERKFNEVVGLYDKMRPTYVEELYHDLFNYIDINQDSKVLGGTITIYDTIDLELARKV